MVKSIPLPQHYKNNEGTKSGNESSISNIIEEYALQDPGKTVEIEAALSKVDEIPISVWNQVLELPKPDKRKALLGIMLKKNSIIPLETVDSMFCMLYLDDKPSDDFFYTQKCFTLSPAHGMKWNSVYKYPLNETSAEYLCKSRKFGDLLVFPEVVKSIVGISDNHKKMARAWFQKSEQKKLDKRIRIYKGFLFEEKQGSPNMYSGLNVPKGTDLKDEISMIEDFVLNIQNKIKNDEDDFKVPEKLKDYETADIYQYFVDLLYYKRRLYSWELIDA